MQNDNIFHISCGQSLCSKGDELRKITPEYLYNSIRNPRPEIASMISQLRAVRNIDLKAYSNAKRQLPYFVCGVFNPAVRKTGNFAYAQCFVMDIDKVSEKGMDLCSLRILMCSDSRVMMCFASPSMDGLKVLFRLKDRCMDAGLYKAFYQVFARKFSVQYHLEQVVDVCTCDVTRACFISMDPDAYYNPDAESVDMAAWVDCDNPDSILQELKAVRHEIAEQAAGALPLAAQKEKTPEPGNEVIANIRKTLGMAPQRKRCGREVIMPEVLNELMDDLTAYIEQTGAVVENVRNINYAKQITVRIAEGRGMLNLFSGKRGFTLVRVPSQKTNDECNNLTHDLVMAFLATRNLI